MATEMSDAHQSDPVPVLNEAVLFSAWARVAENDVKAKMLKQTYVERRKWVLRFILISSITASLTAVVVQPVPFLFLFLVSLILPGASTLLMQDAILFTGTTSWIKYRYVAEQMRMHIILYRAGVSGYDGDHRLMDDRLNYNLIQIDKDMVWGNIIPIDKVERVAYPDFDGLLRQLWRKDIPMRKEDFFSPITVETYLEARAKDQFNWYNANVNKDFGGMRRYTRLMRFALYTSSMVTALSLVLYPGLNFHVVFAVAIFNAFAAFFNAYSEVHLFGKTYVSYHIAAKRLDDQINIWKAKQDNPDFQQNQAKESADFIVATEKLLEWERNEWYDMALQAQARVDNEILNDLTRLEQRADNAQVNASSAPSPQTPAAP